MEAESVWISKLQNCLFEGTTITSASRFSTEGEGGHWIKLNHPCGSSQTFHTRLFFVSFSVTSLVKKKCDKNSSFLNF